MCAMKRINRADAVKAAQHAIELAASGALYPSGNVSVEMTAENLDKIAESMEKAGFSIRAVNESMALSCFRIDKVGTAEVTRTINVYPAGGVSGSFVSREDLKKIFGVEWSL